MEIPNYVPRNYHCELCRRDHPVSMGNENDLVRFRDKFVVKCGGHYIARWLSNHRVMVPINPPVSVPVHRRRFAHRNALVALLDPPVHCDVAPLPPAFENRPLPHRVIIALEIQNNHCTYRAADVLRESFAIALLDPDTLVTLHYHDLAPYSLQIREGDQYVYLGDRTVPLAADVDHISLRGRSRLFPFRYARDMADAFATFETYCGLHPDASPVDGFHYAFPDIDWPGELTFFDAQLDWQTVTPQLRSDCANGPYNDDYLWARIRGAAAEHRRLGRLVGSAPRATVKQEPGSAPNALKRKRSNSARLPNVKKERRGSSAAPIIIDSDDDSPVIEID